MLYVFHVDTGTMLTFDMNVAMQSVSHLQEAIMKQCHIPRDKQVLLISGGENLEPTSRVCSYSAGTDSNPIFLFSKVYIESPSPVPTASAYTTDTSLNERMEGCLHMPPTYETVVCRAQLALQFSDVARDEYRVCEHLVHDQHLQHQGWAAVIANLDDVTSAFRTRKELFQQSFNEYLSTRAENLDLIARFSEVVVLLEKIPIVPSLAVFTLSNAKTMLEWINAQDKRNTLDQMVLQCRIGLEQFDDKLYETVITETSAMLLTVDNVSMKEVKGLEERLSGLEQLMISAGKLVDEQVEMAQGFVQNQTRVRNLQDASILPDLCSSHRKQLTLILRNHQSLQDIHRRCLAAKDELSANLHARLRWVMYVEKAICDLDDKLIIRHETLKKIRHRIAVLRQIHEAPPLYCRALVEIFRRKKFSEQYVKSANVVFENYNKVLGDEMERRSQFETSIGKHFLKALFPGLDDIPPAFVTKCAPSIDDRLPVITESDVSFICDAVPELAEMLRLPEVNYCHLLELCQADSAAQPAVGSVSSAVQQQQQKQEQSADGAIDVSTQSVEIISHEESHMYDLETLTDVEPVVADKHVTIDADKRRSSVDTVTGTVTETFLTADFSMDESLSSSLALQRKVLDSTGASTAADGDSIKQELCQLRTANKILLNEIELHKTVLNNVCDVIVKYCRTDAIANSSGDVAGVTSDSVSKEQLSTSKDLQCFVLDQVKSLIGRHEQLSNELRQKSLETDELIHCQQKKISDLEQQLADQGTTIDDMRQLVTRLETEQQSARDVFEAEKAQIAQDLTEKHVKDLNDLLKYSEQVGSDKAKLAADVSALNQSLTETREEFEVLQNNHQRVQTLLAKFEKFLDSVCCSLNVQHVATATSGELCDIDWDAVFCQCSEIIACLLAVKQDCELLKQSHESDIQALKQQHEQELSVLKADCQQNIDVHCGNVERLQQEVDALKTSQLQHESEVAALKQQIEVLVAEKQHSVESLELTTKQHDELIESLNRQHADAFELLKSDHEKLISQLKEEHNRALGEIRTHHDIIVHQLKVEHERVIDDLKSSSIITDVANQSELLLTDYIPVQRHEEALNELKEVILSAEERRNAELRATISEHQQEINDLKDSYEKQMLDLRTQYENELMAIKVELMARSQLAAVAANNAMMESVVSAPVAGSHSRHALSMSQHPDQSSKRSNEATQQELQQLDDKLMELALSPQVYEQVKQVITMDSCKEGDIVLFTWDVAHRCYVAFLASGFPKYFLSTDCFESLGISPEVATSCSSNSPFVDSQTVGVDCIRKSLVLQVTSREYCLAKKPNNRFRVEVGTRFFRVRAKQCSLITSSSPPSADE